MRLEARDDDPKALELSTRQAEKVFEERAIKWHQWDLTTCKHNAHHKHKISSDEVFDYITIYSRKKNFS